MTILKTIELEGKTLQVRKNHSGESLVINGKGSYANLTKAQARALFGALRDLDNEGFLDDETST